MLKLKLYINNVIELTDEQVDQLPPTHPIECNVRSMRKFNALVDRVEGLVDRVDELETRIEKLAKEG